MTRYHATANGDVAFTAEEETARDAEEATWAAEAGNRAGAGARDKRDDLLASTDWTQVADAKVDQAAWATYRQALRDITAHANFPDLELADWPIAPGV